MTEDRFYDQLVAMRWPDKVNCPFCASCRFYDYRHLKLFRCANPDCRKNFSPTTGTIFQWRKLSPEKLVEALRVFPMCQSAYDLQRALGVQYKSAHYIWKRLKASGGTLTTPALDEMGAA